MRLGLLFVMGLVGCSSDPGWPTRAEILGGSITDAHPAVGVLTLRRITCEERAAEALCTVTLIAPDVVLTAGHCVDAYPDRQLEVLFGASLTDPDAEHRVVVGRVVHPRYDDVSSDFDIVVLRLDRSVAIPPVALMDEPLDATWIGRSVRIVGFGESETVDGAKREGTAVIDTVDELTFRYGPGPAMTCRGDSGGPALTTEGEPRLLGVTSAGDVDCLRWGVDTRVDAHRDTFLDEALAALPRPPPAGLGGADLCEADCVEDSDCPTSWECRSDEERGSRCAPPSLEPGWFEGACTTNAECAMGLCAPAADGCACYTACGVEPPVEPRTTGCSASHPRRTSHLWGLALCFMLVVRARR